MKIYNTLTKNIDEVQPSNPPQVSVYTCGPTVYEYAHIGHWFTYIRMDILIRALRYNGYDPIWIINITDVGHLVSDGDEGEDKLQKGANKEGKTAWDIAEFYAKDFIDCMSLLNITLPSKMPKATEHIDDQIELIKILESKGYTYNIDDGIYYDTSKFPKYTEFAQLDLDEQIAGARIKHNPQKRNPADFALWKFSPTGEKRDMEWDSPWGKGFPGWHIECSAMSMKYLGETIDFHTGGIDHVPVHHANEIAQSEAITGKLFAKYWMHTNHVLIDGQKISKSLGNGIRIQEIKKNNVSYEAFRLHVLESHYRSQSKFSWESLMAAQNRLNDLNAMAALKWQSTDFSESITKDILDKSIQIINNHINNDLNTPEVLAHLSEISSIILNNMVCDTEVADFNEYLKKLDDLLGLNLSKVQDISKQEKELISQREQARREQNWTKSDEIRNALLANGIGLKDTEKGSIWFPA